VPDSGHCLCQRTVSCTYVSNDFYINNDFTFKVNYIIDCVFFCSDQASFCALINGEGEVTDHLRLVHLTKRKNAFKKEEAELKVYRSCTDFLKKRFFIFPQQIQDLETLKQFIINKRPQVIALSGESMLVAYYVEFFAWLVSSYIYVQHIPISETLAISCFCNFLLFLLYITYVPIMYNIDLSLFFILMKCIFVLLYILCIYLSHILIGRK